MSAEDRNRFHEEQCPVYNFGAAEKCECSPSYRELAEWHERKEREWKDREKRLAQQLEHMQRLYVEAVDRGNKPCQHVTLQPRHLPCAECFGMRQYGHVESVGPVSYYAEPLTPETPARILETVYEKDGVMLDGQRIWAWRKKW